VPRFVPASVTELSRVPLLASLPGELLNKLAAKMERQQIAPGEAVIQEGEEGDRFYVVLSGLFTVSQRDLGPRRVLRPGDYFGEVAVALGIPRTMEVRALSAATVASCDTETFNEFLRPLFAED
jgi:ATP-binding cassette subfamily B protein